MPRFLVYVKNLYCVSNVILFRHFRHDRHKQSVNEFIDNQNTISGSTPRGFSYYFGDK